MADHVPFVKPQDNASFGFGSLAPRQFRACCSCGWTGPARLRRPVAQADALEHGNGHPPAVRVAAKQGWPSGF